MRIRVRVVILLRGTYASSAPDFACCRLLAHNLYSFL